MADKEAAIAARFKEEHQAACHLVAQMHAAAVGEVAGPNRGVVEDVEDLRLRAEWKARAEKAEAALKAGRVEAARMWRLLERLDDQCDEGGAGAIQAIHIELHAVLAFRDAARGVE